MGTHTTKWPLSQRFPKAEQDRTQRELSDDLILVVGKGNNVNGSTHLLHVLGELVGDFLVANRKGVGLASEECHLLTQDCAPCHCSGNATETGESGLKEKRNTWYKLSRVVNHLCPRNGTPELCVNDQVHKLLLSFLRCAIN